MAEPTSSSAPPGQRKQAFAALYEANFHRVVGYALRRTDRRVDAEDVVAEVFLVAWRKLDEAPKGGDARAWLYGVARKSLANQRRGTERRVQLADRLRENVDRADRSESDPAMEGAAHAFDRLRHSDQEVLALLAWEGLAPREIARVLDCSRNAARIRIHRARRRFMAELAMTSDAPSTRKGVGSPPSLLEMRAEETP